MPTYEYVCNSCGADLEIVQSMSEPSLTVCPECGAEGLRKLFRGVGIHFKGSGFYRTDSRDGKKAASTSTGAKSESSGSDGSGSSTKGTSGTETKSSSTPASTSSGSSSSGSSGSSSTSS